MSVKLVKEEIKRFLSTPDPEVICIMGKWGAGKTYAWNQYLKEAIKNGSIGLQKYSYVSLFGQNSLEQLKYSIFENTINIKQIESGSNLDTLQGAVDSLKNLIRKGASYVTSLPKVNDYASLFARSFFLVVRKQIICIDDLERIGDGLSTRDVLGLVSFLREQRGCKIVLLLNDEELEKKASDDFEKQLEKVVDIEMRFEPTPQEAVNIGVNQSTPYHERLSQICISLGIVNIRVIRKIQRFLNRIEELLRNHDKRIFNAALPSVTLFCWVIYQPQLAPSLDFIKNFNSLAHLFDDKKEEPEEEKKWRLLLASINFAGFDEFDGLLLESVEKGYFDSEKIEKEALEIDKKLNLQDQDKSFHNAWGKYHGSFKNNGEEVLDEMFIAFKAGVQSVSPTNLDGTVVLFRKMGRDAQADEMISYYINQRAEQAEFFDPKRSVFLRLRDPKLAQAFADKLSTFKDNRPPKEILLHIARSNGWNPEDITALASVTTSDFYNIFKAEEGDDLRIIVSQALRMRRYNPTGEDMQKISANAEEALKLIALESEINKLRVITHGIKLDEVEEVNEQQETTPDE